MFFERGEADIVRAAAASRMAVVAASALLAAIASPYDSSASIAAGGGAAAGGAADGLVGALAAHLGHWDGVFMLRVAEAGGYEYELFHAFYPLFPAVVWGVRCVMLRACPAAPRRRVPTPTCCSWLMAPLMCGTGLLSMHYVYMLAALCVKYVPAVHTRAGEGFTSRARERRSLCAFAAAAVALRRLGVAVRQRAWFGLMELMGICVDSTLF